MEPERLSFQYNGIPFARIERESTEIEKDETHLEEFLLPDELKVTKIFREYEEFGAYEWVTWFENASERQSGMISCLNDGDFQLPFDYDEILPSRGCLPAETRRKIYNPIGSIWSRTEFSCQPQTILPGESKYFSTSGGRSSQQNAPFFDIHKKRERRDFCNRLDRAVALHDFKRRQANQGRGRD